MKRTRISRARVIRAFFGARRGHLRVTLGAILTEIAVLAASMLACGGILALSGCRQEAVNPVALVSDLRPPAILGLVTTASDGLSVSFDEELGSSVADLGIFGGEGTRVAPVEAEVRGSSLDVKTASGLVAGGEYRLEGRIQDRAGNSLGFILPFYGHNPDPAEILINEVRTVSSSPRCDLVELYVVRGGLCSGMCLQGGSPSDHDWSYCLPLSRVETGQYLVIHLRTRAGESPVDDLVTPTSSTGADCTAMAWDLWYPGEAALPNANGALCLRLNPEGPVLDALLYSDRTSSSDSDYGGFGSTKFRARVVELAGSGSWKGSDDGGDGSQTLPEDLASSAGTTESRTLCRSSASADSDSRDDWHVVPTKGATWGAANGDPVYVPAE